jgi:hypothetical protein
MPMQKSDRKNEIRYGHYGQKQKKRKETYEMLLVGAQPYRNDEATRHHSPTLAGPDR